MFVQDIETKETKTTTIRLDYRKTTLARAQGGTM